MHRFDEIVLGQLVVEPTPLKNMSSSVGMMKFPTYGKIKFMFQTSNQIRSIVVLKSELGTNPDDFGKLSRSHRHQASKKKGKNTSLAGVTIPQKWFVQKSWDNLQPEKMGNMSNFGKTRGLTHPQPWFIIHICR